MARKGALVIKDWQRGMGNSSFTGFGEMRGVDPFNVPGILKTTPGSVSVGGSAVASRPTKIVYDSTNTKWYMNQVNNDVVFSTDAGDTWSNLAGETLTAGGGNGLEFWNDNLFHFRNSKVDVYNGVDWFNSWSGMSFSYTTANALRPTLAGSDGVMYIGDGQYIATLAEKGSFDVENSGTYTFTAQALDIFSGQIIKCLAERGTWILAGTDKGYIFPWDRLSQSFFMPINVGETPIHAMLTKDDFVYFWAGPRCQMYVTDGKTVRKVTVIPEDALINDDSSYSSTTALTISPFSVMVHDGNIKFGRNDGIGASGVWAYNNGKLILETIGSVNSSGSGNAQIDVGALFPLAGKGQYLWGYTYIDTDSNTSYKLDKWGGSGASSVGFVLSPWYRVGDHLTPRTFTSLRLTTTGNASGTVTISYRTKNGASFTTAATLSVSSIQPSYLQPITITAEILQVKIAISGSCEVYEIVLE